MRANTITKIVNMQHPIGLQVDSHFNSVISIYYYFFRNDEPFFHSFYFVNIINYLLCGRTAYHTWNAFAKTDTLTVQCVNAWMRYTHTDTLVM